MNHEKILIIIPAYNESENITRIVDELVHNYPMYDYIIVNDGSKDNTLEICKERGYRYLNLPVNIGLAGAVQTGMLYAWQNGYKGAIQFDGDGQHRAEYIHQLEAAIDEGYDIAIGSRFVTEKKLFSFRMLGSFLIGCVIKIATHVSVKDPTSGMRMFSRNMIKEFAFNMNYGPEPDTIAFLIRRGAKLKEIQVSMDERIAGTSYLNMTTAAKYMFRMILSISIIQWFRK